MWFSKFQKKRCRNCYACVRTCPVNAIRVKDGQANIIKERCIVCGNCSKTCRQYTNVVKSDVKLVKSYLRENNKVVVSLAPSFAAVYGINSDKVLTALRKLGFHYIEETVSGLEPIMNVYSDYANREDGKNYITSFCPSVSNLIQKHYPELLPSLVPVIPPYICHSMLLKEKYGKDSKVIFIGPCLAKKVEGDIEKSIDGVLTFDELNKWIKEENIDLEELEEGKFDCKCEKRRLFPIVGQPTKELKDKNPQRKIFYIDGIEDCIETIKGIKNNRFENVLFEMSLCRNSCIGGSGMPKDNTSYYERRENLENYVNKKISNDLLSKDKIEISNCKLCDNLNSISICKEFKNLNIPLKVPTNEEITKILNKLGKYTKADEIDCGNCGYKTCREKAVAVFNGMAELSMCLPFMRQNSERLTNVIFETTPNLILVVNEDLDIVDMNPAAQKFFDIRANNEQPIPVVMFLEEDKFAKVRDEKEDILKDKIKIPYNNAIVIQNIIGIKESEVILWIADDITRDELKEIKYQQMKIDAVNMAQKVINNQMIVAQEIASLLGETTAETKVTLTQLKNLINEEGKRL